MIPPRKATTMSPEEVLALPMPQNDADAATVRDYLKALLLKLWREGEGVSGKRPFGNSGWDSDLLDVIPEDACVSQHPTDIIEGAIKAL